MSRSVDVHKFAMIPRSDVPRSRFDRQSAHKTTFDAGYLVPIYVDEVLPGDSFVLKSTFFARLATPIFPILDNLTLESFFFFVPNRLIWDNWQRFMGEQDNPGSSTAYLIPQCVSPTSGYPVNSLFDYFGLPTVGQVASGQTVSHSALPLRAYQLIYREWFRDENLVSAAVVNTGDGPDSPSSYALMRRGKRHDYFTSCLPWPQKGAAVALPLTGNAPVRTFPTEQTTGSSIPGIRWRDSSTGAYPVTRPLGIVGIDGYMATTGASVPGATVSTLYPSNLAADLSAVTAVTINALRQSFQIQKLLERDARGGTRYTEILRAHFGVVSPDFRLDRPEYLGGGRSPVVVHPISQTSASSISGSGTPLGTLGAMGTALADGHGFRQSFTEHGYIIGIIHVGADLTYQQGLRKLWSRSTRYDFYWPEFAMLGEQAVLNKELYVTGTPTDNDVFGYQERWSEYRYFPSLITGRFRSTSAGTLDGWHLSQRFTALPTLNATFIYDTPPMDRILAVGSSANGSHFLLDSFFNIRTVRPLPMYSVPGLIDHF